MVPGKARDFRLRVTATGKNEIAFTGAEAFEGEEGALEPPGDGETVTPLPTYYHRIYKCCGSRWILRMRRSMFLLARRRIGRRLWGAPLSCEMRYVS